MEYSRDMLVPQQFYQLATAAIQPRPIAWITTVNQAGVVNLAPFSFFNVANINPPILSVSIIHKPQNQYKDTLLNLKRYPECVINIVTPSLAEKMNQTSADYPETVSELEAVGLEKSPSQDVSVPGVALAPVRFECRVRQIIDFGAAPSGGHLVLLDVCHITVADHVLNANQKLDPAKCLTLGRLGGNGYVTTEHYFEMVRPINH